ncbi:NUDIX hydrolase [Pacificibacter maritimus]|nr:NUDIX hydrolase [Pacificibacter maritimus]
MSKVLEPFHGSKIAILRHAEVLTLLRDDTPTIPFPNMWDLPGGGREGCESPFATVARELHEELAIKIDPSKIIHHRVYLNASALRVHFYVARWDNLSDAAIHLGDEGQAWTWMPIATFVTHEKAVPTFRERLHHAVNDLGITP